MKKSFWKKAAGVCPCLGLLLLIGVLAAGCQSPNEKQFSAVPHDLFGTETNSATLANGSSTNAGSSALGGILRGKGDTFAVGDLVTVKFSGTSDQLPPHEERIKDDGTITLPLIGAVQAAGKTAGELQTEIHDHYVPDFYKRLTVIVTGEQRVYYVGGHVKQPGRQIYIGKTTVTKAIQSAGDFDDFAAKNRVELTRADGKTLKVNCIKAAKDSTLDPEVYPGDKIHVPLRGLWDIFD